MARGTRTTQPSDRAPGTAGAEDGGPPGEAVLAPADGAADLLTPNGIGVPPDPTPDDDRAERFAAGIGVTFKNPALLRLALTHRSILVEWVAAGLLETAVQSNERLEFLGDALLGAIVAEYLYRTELDAPEGALTARRVALVRAEALVRWAREIELGEALYLAQGEKITSGARDRILAGAFEALVGAIYLDRGLPTARRFVARFLKREAPAFAGPADANPKGHLQEVLQERFRRSPSYRIAQISGPDHARVFTIEARLDERVLGVGTGGSKREAEQSAARAALAGLEGGGRWQVAGGRGAGEAAEALTPPPRASLAPLPILGEGEPAAAGEVGGK